MFAVEWEPFLIVLGASLILSIFIALVYKLTTDQGEMRRLRERMKSLQQQVKERKGDQDEQMRLSSEMLKANSEYMKKTLKSSLYTIIPAMILFWFLLTQVAFAPISPGGEFSILVNHAEDIDPTHTQIILPGGFSHEDTIHPGDETRTLRENQAVFVLRAPMEEGTYAVSLENSGVRVERDIIVTQGREYAQQDTRYDDVFESARIEYQSLTILTLPFWPHQMNWLWLYIIFSIVLGQLFRKLLRVY